jgi:hypothetical protein
VGAFRVGRGFGMTDELDTADCGSISDVVGGLYRKWSRLGGEPPPWWMLRTFSQARLDGVGGVGWDWDYAVAWGGAAARLGETI